MPYKPVKYDYVSWVTGTGDDKETKYGQILSVTGAGSEQVEIQQIDKEDKDAKTAASGLTKLRRSAWARMKMRAKPNFRELAENVAVASLYHPFIMKNSLFGAENISFLLADATHEFLIKGFAEQMMDMLKATSLEKDSDSCHG